MKNCRIFVNVNETIKREFTKFFEVMKAIVTASGSYNFGNCVVYNEKEKACESTKVTIKKKKTSKPPFVRYSIQNPKFKPFNPYNYSKQVNKYI